MLQRVAVCCSVLQRVAVCCSVLQCVAVCYMYSSRLADIAQISRAKRELKEDSFRSKRTLFAKRGLFLLQEGS